MGPNDPAMIAVLLAIAFGLVEVVKALVGRLFERKNGTHKGGLNGHTDRVISQLDTVHEIISLKDEDGKPRVYWPRSLEAILDNVLDIQHKSIESQQRMVDTLNHAANTLERIDGKLDKAIEEQRGKQGR